ncbi:MAG: hypothetical protein PHX07_02270 [Candidatus Marinimicrobia bacterium]|jgi:hypothetical protein|nr:hypothetical protein [Candidatus Neomarinimicrobiota bacterium]MDD5710342.1 hypothetical protein [Candidatus Neomarinimicrobiota bacterium]MDX9778140.1 hypothetical protein [bacterium]
MQDFDRTLQKLLGHEVTAIEKKAFAGFDPQEQDREKRFNRYNISRDVYINIDDTHYLYLSNHRDALRCRLDMAAHYLYSPLCYEHEDGRLMLGITRPEQEQHIRSRFIDYAIYFQPVSSGEDEKDLQLLRYYAAYIALVAGEAPWERLCRVCLEHQTGAHITAAAQRLFAEYENALLYFIPDNRNADFKAAAEKAGMFPRFLGKTVRYPVLNLDNEDGLLDIPLSTLRLILQQLQQYSPARNGIYEAETEADSIFEEDIPADPAALLKLIEFEHASAPTRRYADREGIPDLQIDTFPMWGMRFNEKSAELHALSAIVDLQVRGKKILAMSYFIESSAAYPQDNENVMAVLRKSAALFDIPLANSRIHAGENDRLTLFFVSRDTEDPLPAEFSDAGDFICLLGDPNGELRGSAYAKVLGKPEGITPPGVMTGTLAALVDVLNACNEKRILASARMIRRGGLFAALHHACGNRRGANIYSERKGSEAAFVYGEPQAAVLISIKEKYLIDLARITSNYNITSTTIGRVTAEPGIVINNRKRYPL